MFLGVDCGEIKVFFIYKNGSFIELVDNCIIILGFVWFNLIGNFICGFLFINFGGLGVFVLIFVGVGFFVLEIGFFKNVMWIYDIIGFDLCGVGLS